MSEEIIFGYDQETKVCEDCLQICEKFSHTLITNLKEFRTMDGNRVLKSKFSLYLNQVKFNKLKSETFIYKNKKKEEISQDSMLNYRLSELYKGEVKKVIETVLKSN